MLRLWILGASIVWITPALADPYVLDAGAGEKMFNGLVIKASPASGTERAILVEQTFPRGGTTGAHIHDLADELFYVVDGHGQALLGDRTEDVDAGDVIFVPKGAMHMIQNQEHDDPLVVVFFMDSPELADEFRAAAELMRSGGRDTLTSEEWALINKRIGGTRPASE